VPDRIDQHENDLQVIASGLARGDLSSRATSIVRPPSLTRFDATVVPNCASPTLISTFKMSGNPAHPDARARRVPDYVQNTLNS
jgi:hypothetical protein